MRIAIIGSGVASLAAASSLASKGHNIEVFEANSYFGGKLTSFHQDGFRFDAGPSLFTIPDLLDNCFIEAGKNPRDYYSYIKIPDSCIYYFHDGTRLAAKSDKEEFAKEVESKLGTPANKILEHLEESALIYKNTHSLFMERSLHKLKNYFKKDVLDALINVHKLNLLQTMHKVNTKRFSDKRLVQLFDRFATYNGSNPYKAPGVLNIIPHLEHNIGTFFPIGGMQEISKSLYQLCLDLGVNFSFNSRVEKINVKGKKAHGIKVNGENLEFDKIISNSDIFPTFRKLLSEQKAPENTLKQERSSSALIFYWGINKEFPQLGLHNILFSEDYKKEFEYLFEKFEIYSDPTVYINISSKYNKDDSPKGSENWFVMINVPANKGQNWDAFIVEARRSITKRINMALNVNIEEHILNESVLDPIKIESKTSSYQGSLYGTSSNTRFAAFLRQANYSSKIKDLYFCGGSVHPGGGIPLCLLSGKIVSDLIS